MSDFNEGDGEAIIGKAERTVGDVANRPDLERAGAAKEIKGKVQSAAATLKDKAADLGDTVSSVASQATDQAKDLYAQASEQYDAAVAQIDPFVRERPYAAIGIAAVVGLLVGLAWNGRGSKVVYLKPRA